jgi:hypothetical protein
MKLSFTNHSAERPGWLSLTTNSVTERMSVKKRVGRFGGGGSGADDVVSCGWTVEARW